MTDPKTPRPSIAKRLIRIALLPVVTLLSCLGLVMSILGDLCIDGVASLDRRLK
jgi:hypothetical protein